MLTTFVVPETRSRTTMSELPSVSPPGTRFDASVSNATYRPSSLMAGSRLAPLPCVPASLTLTRLVLFATWSRMNTSPVAFVSFATRLDALEPKATTPPC